VLDRPGLPASGPNLRLGFESHPNHIGIIVLAQENPQPLPPQSFPSS
jgi:hypothetical protein